VGGKEIVFPPNRRIDLRGRSDYRVIQKWREFC
jgi:hypothetical protein